MVRPPFGQYGAQYPDPEWVNDYLSRALPMIEEITRRLAKGQDLSFQEMVISAVFFGVWKEMLKGPIGNLNAFVYRLVKSNCSKIHKRESKHRHADLLDHDEPVSSQEFSVADYDRLLERMKSLLTPAQEDVLEMRASGLSNKEIAKHRGTSTAAVRKLFGQIKAVVARYISDLDGGDSLNPATSTV